MRVEIDELLFQKMIKSVEHCVAKDDYRPILKYILLRFSADKVTAYSCDGYRAAKTTIPLLQPTEQDFECYIKPIKTNPRKGKTNPVVIEYDGKSTSVEVVTEYGNIKYSFAASKETTEKYIDIEKVYEGAKACDRNIGMNADFVKKAMNALQNIKVTNKNHVIFKCQVNPVGSFVICAREGNCVSEQLVLPVRITEERNKE